MPLAALLPVSSAPTGRWQRPAETACIRPCRCSTRSTAWWPFRRSGALNGHGRAQGLSRCFAGVPPRGTPNETLQEQLLHGRLQKSPRQLLQDSCMGRNESLASSRSQPLPVLSDTKGGRRRRGRTGATAATGETGNDGRRRARVARGKQRHEETRAGVLRIGPGGYNMFGPRAALELRAQETILPSPDSHGTSGFEVKPELNYYQVLLNLV